MHDYLERHYLKILRSEYGIAADEVSNEDGPGLDVYKPGQSLSEFDEAVTHAARAYSGRVRIFNGYWRRLLTRAVAALPQETGIGNIDICIGQVPDAAFNAGMRPLRTWKGRRGFLILINLGLELFLYRIARVMVGSMRLKVLGPDGEEVVEPEIDLSTAREILLRNLKLIAAQQHEWPISLKGSRANWLAASYAYALQQYVIGHELGHVLFAVRRRKLQQIQGSWGEEHFADGVGTHVCHGLIDHVVSAGELPQDLASQILFEAPYIVFPLFEALDRILDESGIRRLQSHPPADVRMKKLFEVQLGMQITPDFVAMAQERAQHMRALTSPMPI